MLTQLTSGEREELDFWVPYVLVWYFYNESDRYSLTPFCKDQLNVIFKHLRHKDMWVKQEIVPFNNKLFLKGFNCTETVHLLGNE